MSDNKVESEGILIPKEALDELNISPEELEEAISKSKGEIHLIPRRIQLTFEEVAEMLKGGQVIRGDVSVSIFRLHTPDK